ncbi:MAG: phosphate ABC transporter substrate-binding protein PstS [Infirmifilum sp.]|jgi:phosphate transport system substrate-binding protein|uniref:phosphate ABC transporter substrate-binding protein PstS n=1 Tax=Infirmifilum TaxID=2856573 RepID=UPI00069BA080|nr:phosphate ABC transporter substrate-binding protein PstS [Infirmifilum uzonense]
MAEKVFKDRKMLGIVAAVIILIGILAFILTGSSQSQEPAITENVLLVGSGATFPQPQINAWIQAFTKKYPNVKIEYGGGGSGKGQTDLLQGVVDFAGSDVPMKTENWEQAKAKYGKVYQIPWISGGVAFVYNIPEVGSKRLKLSREALVGILLGKIEYWDDPVIKKDNPDLNLPHQKIIFVHRSEASGTTNIVTAYLSLISPEWKEKVGSGLTVKWPLDAVGRGVGAQGNPGVAQNVKATPYSLGYVEQAYTKGLQVALIENGVGEYVDLTPESVSKALSGLTIQFDPAEDISKIDLLSKTLNVKASGAYPIVSMSYVIVKDPAQYPTAKARALGAFLKYVFTEGQQTSSIIEGYAPVGGSFVKAGLKVAEELLARK